MTSKWIFTMGLVVGVGLSNSAGLGDEKQLRGLVVEESFDDGDLAARGWYDVTTARIVGEGVAGQGCLEYEWAEGDSQTRGSGAMRRIFQPRDEIFIRYYLKLSKNWGWSGRNYHPHLSHFLTTENRPFDAPATTHLTLYVEPVGGRLRLAATDMQNKDAAHGLTQGPLRGGFNGNFYDSEHVVFDDDRWHCIEAQFKLNTLDLTENLPNADGIARGWFDGRLLIERTNLVLRTVDFPQMRLNQFFLAPYFAPGLLPQAQKLWIDELAIGTERIGPLAAGQP